MFCFYTLRGTKEREQQRPYKIKRRRQKLEKKAHKALENVITQ